MNAILPILLAAASATSTTLPAPKPQSRRSQSIGACNSWFFNFTVNAYVCSSPEFNVQVPTVYDVQDMQSQIRLLEQKVDSLTRRVEALETGR